MLRFGSAKTGAKAALTLTALLASALSVCAEPPRTIAAVSSSPEVPFAAPADKKPGDAGPDTRPLDGATPEAKPPENKPPVTGERQGVEKPAINSAIRAALQRAQADAAHAAPELRAQLQGVSAFYASRGDAPLWLDKDKWTPAAHSAFARLQKAAEDGLDLRAYRIYSLDAGSEKALALGDVALSQATAAYAFQASGGRGDPQKISSLIGSRPEVVKPEQALQEVAQARDADATLQGYNPQSPGYKALREKLAQVRAEPAGLALLDPPRPSRRRRRDSDAPAAAPGPRGAALEAEILANMEFWRWQPRDPGADRIVVNIPEFTSRLYRDNAVALTTRVIVGQPTKETPLFSSKMEYLVVNPSWNVPESIIRNEMMGRVGNLSRAGYSVTYVHGKLHIRQLPGERNALGRVKFIFPNNYSVYLHDTPSRHLFATEKRAYSHGCVRVDQPFQLAVALLGADHGWTEERFKKMFGKYERRVDLPAPLPIHLVYFTLAVDEKGELRRFGDIYGYAAKERGLLGLGG